MRKAMSYAVGALAMLLVVSSCNPDIPSSISTELELLPEHIDFNFHVKPILSDRCYSCHGPDENTRQADLRLDLREEAFGRLSSGNGNAIVKGQPAKSELIKRILSKDPEIVMPTPESHLFLSDKEKAILYKWIDQGAEWKEHWAFLPISKSSVDEDYLSSSKANEIDYFIDQRLRQEGLAHSEPADKERLIRRLTMDLTGLPPTIEAIDAFVADSSEGAYGRLVDNLLNTTAYAERMTMEWLDVSRYADSHGLHADGARSMWPWRDWVIEAFSSNMPYDQFGTWQLAGDLLPEATIPQKLATAFNRNHMMTGEGGAIDEEYRLGYVFDRAETTGTAFLGLTTMCAKCHDHKFDPISQEDYYEMSAFFNNVREIGMTGDDGEYGPTLSLADEATTARLASLNGEIIQLESELNQLQLREVKQFLEADNYLPTRPSLSASYETITERKREGNYKFDNNDNVRSNALNGLETGISGKAVRLKEDYDDFNLFEIPTYEATDEWSTSMWINTDQRDSLKMQSLLCTTGHKNNFWRGWEWYLDGENRLNARLINNLPGNLIHVRTQETIETGTWTHVAMTYDGSIAAKGLQLYINGILSSSEIVYDRLYRSIKTINDRHQDVHRNVRVGKSNRAFTGEYGIYEGLIDETSVYNYKLTEAEVASLYNLHSDDPVRLDESMIKRHENARSVEVLSIKEKIENKRTNWLDISNGINEIMVMEEMPIPRQTYVYDRGEYQLPTYTVKASTPDALGDFPEELPQNRLGLSKWIFSESNPLTPRVTVNRYWQMIWGNGLVSTPGDFGIQGSLPTHPELLDWLAADFRDNGWDVKRLIKQMVMSRTYRSSSKVDDLLLEKDPDNILLARAPTYRLPAEMIRDNALAASGLLVQSEVGGASVKPYQPEGLWIEKTSFSQALMRYKPDHGDSLYRRSMYTFIRRTQPHPAMTIFDQPNREICTVKRENTNTPLQALVLLNDPQFVEAAKALAQRMQFEGGAALANQLTYAFRLVTGRTPAAEELSIFERLYQDQLSIYQDSITDARTLLAIGESTVDESFDISKTAALTIVASTMINHDEAYTKR